MVQAGPSQAVAGLCRRAAIESYSALPGASGLCLLPAPLHKLRGLGGWGGRAEGVSVEGEAAGGRGWWSLLSVGFKPQQEGSELELGAFNMELLGDRWAIHWVGTWEAREPLSRRWLGLD